MKKATLTLILIGLLTAVVTAEEIVRLENDRIAVECETRTGRWSLLDKRSGVRWPSAGTASIGAAAGLQESFDTFQHAPSRSIRLLRGDHVVVSFELLDDGGSVRLRYEGEKLGDVRALGDVLSITDSDRGGMLVPCREGLFIPADSGVAFRRTFGTSDYEGCHMNMLGFIKSGAAMVVSWDDAYVFPEVSSTLPKGKSYKQELTAHFTLRRSARSLTLTPLGKGDWNTIAAGYRELAERQGLAATLRQKIRRNPLAERLVGAANFKLWTCLARRMNEESTGEEAVNIRWTFEEAARIAEHLHDDVGIERCLFIMGGWTEGGYDCRHPDNLPANPECGGNKALTAAIERIQKLGFVVSLHDNYQDMYRDAKSWDPKFIEKRPDGSLIKGGRWLGGRAYMVCAPRQLELARRPQNLPAIRKLFPAWSYFIDTTYAVGPRECHDPAHPVGRNEDIAWKIRLSDYARDVFGLFGSECGREWALPHSDFFEGLVAVSGKYFHNLDPASLGAVVVPLWEMVYHDCQVCYGKYGYSADHAAEYVAHHVLCARPLHYHSIPDHLYWKNISSPLEVVDARPRVLSVEPAGPRAFRIRYAWDVNKGPSRKWRVFVHFGTPTTIKFQDDHPPAPPTSAWKKNQTVEIGPRTVHVPGSIRDQAVNIYMGLFDPENNNQRAPFPGCDRERRLLIGRLHLAPAIRFEPAPVEEFPDLSCYTRCDRGWAEGLHPLDIFLKNTQEVLGPLHRVTAHDRLTNLAFIDPQRTVRRAIYGQGDKRTTVVVNFGSTEATVDTRFGGRSRLPPFGFVAENERFIAFHATRWNGRDYEDSALFTLQALDDRGLTDSRKVRIFHGFGDPVIRWKESELEVRRERVVER